MKLLLLVLSLIVACVTQIGCQSASKVIAPHDAGKLFSVGQWAYDCEGFNWYPTSGGYILVVGLTVRNDGEVSNLPPAVLVDSAGHEHKHKGGLGLFTSTLSHRELVFDVPLGEYSLQVSDGSSYAVVNFMTKEKQ